MHFFAALLYQESPVNAVFHCRFHQTFQNVFSLIPHQEAIIQIMKMRKKITNAQLQTELVEILKNMFLPQKKMIKEQIEWLIEHKYIRRDESDINTFIYMA